MPTGMTIVIPETVTHDGVQYTVTAVDDRSFYGWKGVSFALPSTVTSIGASAFSKNMTKAEASAVVFALKADPSSESLLDLGLLNYMKVTMKEDTDGTINDGWPYAQISTKKDPYTMKNLLGFARYLTATLDVQRYRRYHLTDCVCSLNWNLNDSAHYSSTR